MVRTVRKREGNVEHVMTYNGSKLVGYERRSSYVYPYVYTTPVVYPRPYVAPVVYTTPVVPVVRPVVYARPYVAPVYTTPVVHTYV